MTDSDGIQHFYGCKGNSFRVVKDGERLLDVDFSKKACPLNGGSSVKKIPKGYSRESFPAAPDRTPGTMFTKNYTFSSST